MANVTRIAILELAFYGVTIPEERDFIPDELPRGGGHLLVLQLRHIMGRAAHGNVQRYLT